MSIRQVRLHWVALFRANGMSTVKTREQSDRLTDPHPAPSRHHQLQVEAAHIGKLVQLEGIVIRSTAVKPQITVATYVIDTRL